MRRRGKNNTQYGRMPVAACNPFEDERRPGSIAAWPSVGVVVSGCVDAGAGAVA
jgi:hypothetical protein